MNELLKLSGYKDKLDLVRALLTYPFINWTSQFFTRTRDGELTLYFVNYCRSVINYRADELTDKEIADFDRVLIHYELSAYDRLNLWHDYIILFERYRKEKDYTIEFVDSRNDPVFNSYLLYEKPKSKFVHFLYYLDNRYKIICRKQERFLAGKSTAHLKRHRQSQLSDKELADRMIQMEKLFEFIKAGRRMNSCKLISDDVYIEPDSVSVN
ncbi:MAG: hypothetical protein LBD23_18190 [Oscillospiraceae bacterium]|jgi:hypothetical protein|nr:hypothetical protein [Oscillospiraceae bacterium]